MQIHEVVRVIVGHDDRVKAGPRDRSQHRQQARQRPVAEVKRDPKPVVLKKKPGARPTRFRPAATTTKDHQSTTHHPIVSGPAPSAFAVGARPAPSST